MGRLALMAILLLTTSPAIQAQMRGGFRSGAGFGRPAPTVRFGGGFSSFHHSSSIFIGGRVGFGHNPRVHVFFGPSRRAFFHHRFITPYPVYYGYAPYYPSYPDYAFASEASNSSYYSARNDTSYEQGRIDQELQDLRDEVRALREENASSGGGMRQSPPPLASAKPETLPATVLVFRDGHHEEVQNYAIVGDTLWILNERRAKRLPVADLDMQTTKQTNAERGVEFSIPESRH